MIRQLYASIDLSNAEADALEWALHLEKTLNGAACGTGRHIRLRTMRILEKRGYVEETFAVMVDGDGFHLEPERERRCFRLTEAGRAKAHEAKRVDAERQQERLRSAS